MIERPPRSPGSHSPEGAPASLGTARRVACGKCGQEVPEGAIYCPFCTADKGGGEKEVIGGGIRGGLIGLLVGLLPAALLLFIYGPERGIKAIAFAVPVATFTTGLILGLVKAKGNWK